MDPLLRINIDRDLNEIAKLITGYMTKTYINDLTKEVFRCEQECKEHMSREAQLVEALIPFTPDDKKDILRQISRFIRYEQVAQAMLPKLLGPQEMREEGMRQEGVNGDTFIKETIVKVLLFKIMSSIENYSK